MYLDLTLNHTGVTRLTFEMRRIRREWMQAGRPREKSSEIRALYKNAKQNFRRKLRNASRNWKKKDYEELIKSAETDIGTFYKAVKTKRNKKENDGYIIYKGITSKTSEEKCKTWGIYYNDLLSENSDANFDEKFKETIEEDVKVIQANSYHEKDDVTDRKIEASEIKQLIKELKQRKSPGLDLITNEYLIFGGNTPCHYLTLLFNAIIESEIIPESFKTGSVVPIYKGKNKDKTMPSNYRGITLTSAIGKLFEKVLISRIDSWLSEKRITFPHKLQMGFVKGRGATIAAFCLEECIDYYRKRKSPVYTCFLDNEKAFDNVWQNGLFYKLHDLGIKGRIWRLIRNSYTDSTVHISLEGHKSDPISVQKGVGQGRVMSAWMFLVFIDELTYLLQASNSRITVNSYNIPAILLADDTTLLGPSPKALRTLLDIVYLYASRWRLKYNASKSVMITFNSSNNTEPNFALGDIDVPISNSTIYAGILFSSKNTPTIRTDNACVKARKIFHSLYDIGLKYDGIHPLSCVLIWNRVILPSALFGIELWGTLSDKNIENLEKVQRQYVRHILAFDKTSPIEATISVLGMSSVSGYIDKSRLMFFGRLCNSEIDLFHKDIFTNAIAEHSLGFTNICHITKSLINTLLKYDLVEFLHNYIISGYFPPKHIWNNIVKHAIREREEHIWTVNSGARPELSRFVQIQRKLKPNNLLLLSYIFPEYTKDIINVLKIASCPKMNTTCYMCDRDVEDIILHIVMSCQCFVQERNLLYDIIVNILPVELSISFFEQNDEDILTTFLGGLTHWTSNINDEIWVELMLNICEYLNRKWNFRIPKPHML